MKIALIRIKHLPVFYCCILLFILCPCIVSGIEIERFEHIDTRYGLSQNNVLSMFCDHHGFMWFGTMDGLNRYDGYSFKIFKSEEGKQNALTHNRISGIWEDSLNILWIKTYENYYHFYIPETEEFITFPFYNRSLEEKNSAINCSFQMSKDEIWLGSSNSGAYYLKYDHSQKKYQVRQFLSRGPSSITNNAVNFIISDNKSMVFIGTNKGLNLLSKPELKKESPYFSHQFANYHFTSACRFGNHIIFGTKNNGIIVYNIDIQKFEPLTADIEIFKQCEIKNIKQAKKTGELIISTRSHGLCLYSPLTRQIKFFSRYGNNVATVFEDSQGLIWMKTERFGVVKIDPVTGSSRHFTMTPEEVQPVIDDERPYFYEDRDNNLWIGIHGGGLAFYDRINDTFKFYRNVPNSPYTISSDFVHCISEDKSGLLWVGTGQFNGGINKVIAANPSFRHVIPRNSLNSLADNVVRCIFEDHNGYVWISTKSGIIYIYTPDFRLHGTLENIPLVSSRLPGYNVYSMMEDKDGYLWMGSKGGGIVVSSKPLSNPARYKDIKFYSYKHQSGDSTSLGNNSVYSIFEDSEGKIWIGTYGGGLNLVISRASNKLNCRRINMQNSSLSSNDIRHIYQDSKNRLWVASTFGLNMLDDISAKEDSLRFRYFLFDPQDETTLSYNDVVHICEDSDHRLWFATFGGGISLLTELTASDASFKHFRKKDGLINDVVFSIVEDKDKNLWFSTEKGLSKYNKSQGTFDNFDRNSGLFSENFSENTCCITRDGKLLFGSTSGMLVIDPRQINKARYVPPVVITNFQLFNRNVGFNDPDAPIRQSVETLDTIVLKYYQHSFSFEYAALSYFAPDQNSYEFMLENFDKDWNAVGNQRKATYTNVLPGEYIFKIRAASWDGTMNPEPRMVYVKILPPWYKSRLAIFSYIVFMLIVSAVAWRIFLNYYRLQNNLRVERRVNDIKLQFFTNISHELRTPLTLILGPIEDIKSFKNLPKAIAERVEIMERNGKRMLRLISQLLDFRKIQKGKMTLKVQEIDLVNFVKDIYMHFNPIAKQKRIIYKFQADESPVSVFVDPNKFDSVVFNILSNAFKYSKEGKTITISVHKSDDGYAEVAVTDQGPGIPPEKIDMLFQRYTPLSDHNSSFEGTGIGLSLSYEIMKLHKGDILVESRAGAGSCFKIRVLMGKGHLKEEELNTASAIPKPVHAPDILLPSETPEEKFAVSEKQTIKPKLLIVEDNTEIILYLSKILAPEFEIHAVANGNEGLKTLNNFHPDIIITDVMMPVMDGIVMTKQLKSSFESSHIPVVMLTAKSTIEDQIIGIDSGAEAYILKPFNAGYLMAVVKNILRQREYIVRKYRDKKEVDADHVKITPKDDEFMKKIVGIIDANYSDPEFNVEKLVELSAYSRTVMYNKVKGLTGYTPVDFIRQMRLKYAASILKDSDRNVSETAYLAGFNDVKYFSKCFKEMFGASPKDFRRNGNATEANG
ncbi:MAG: response regulator [Bacteroidales bacterium]|nr:response regulator [Bacteroidales bacterium]